MSSIVIRELLTAYGFKTDTKDLDKADGKLEALKKVALGVTAVVGGASVALTGLVKSFATQAQGALEASRVLDITVEEYQELTHAAGNANASTEAFSQALESMLEKLYDAGREGSEVGKVFQKLGVEVMDSNGQYRNRIDIFEETIEALAGMENMTERQVLQQRIFGGQSKDLNTLVLEGVEGFKQSRRELHLYGHAITNDAAWAAKDFNQALSDIGAVFLGLRNIIGSEMIPVFKDLAEQFKYWYLDNQAVIKSNITGWARAAAGALRTFADVVVGVASAVATAIDWLGGLEHILRVIAIIATVWSLMHVINHIKWLIFILSMMGKGALLASLKGFFATLIAGFNGIGNSAMVAYMKAMALPLAIAVAIVALGLLLDDLWAFYNGHDSAIGELAKQWPMLANAMYAFQNAGEQLGDWLYDFIHTDIPGWWEDSVNAFIEAGEDIGDWFYDEVQKMKGDWQIFTTNFTALGEEIGDFFYNLVGLIKIWWGGLMGWFSDTWKSIIDGISRQFDRLLARLADVRNKAADTISSIPGAKTVMRAAGGIAGVFGGASGGSSGQIAAGQDFAERRLQSPEGAPADGGVSIGGDNIEIQITQRPGEDADAFQARLMAEMRREREGQRRQTLDALQNGRRR